MGKVPEFLAGLVSVQFLNRGGGNTANREENLILQRQLCQHLYHAADFCKRYGRMSASTGLGSNPILRELAIFLRLGAKMPGNRG